MSPKFKIGDTVYSAGTKWGGEFQICPDCKGSGKWQVTTPANESFPISCATCRCGYEQRGKIEIWDYSAHVQKLTIGSVRMDTAQDPEDVFEYMCVETGIGSGQLYRESRLFSNRETANGAAEIEAFDQSAAKKKQDEKKWEREKKGANAYKSSSFWEKKCARLEEETKLLKKQIRSAT